MTEKKPILFKGKFKRQKSVFLKNVLAILAFLFFSSLFFALGINSSKNNGSMTFIYFMLCLFGFLVGIVIAFKESMFKFYSIELYEDEIRLKDSFFKEKIIKYDEIIYISAIQNNIMISTRRKGYGITYLENDAEIESFVNQKIKEIKKNRFLSPENEEKNYLGKKKSMKKKIFIECGIFLSMFLGIFFCAFLTGNREIEDFTSMDKTIFLIFIVLEVLLLISAFLYTIVLVKAKNSCEEAKIRYKEALAISLVNEGLGDNVVKVFRTYDGDRIVVYEDGNGSYRCSHEMFILNEKRWFSISTSAESFQSMEDVYEYLEDFKEDIIEGEF